MKQNKKQTKQTKKLSKKAKKVLAIVIASIVFFTAALFAVDSLADANPKSYHRFFISTFAGSFEADGCPNTYYQVEIKKDAQSGKTEYSCINTKIGTTNSANVKEIWVNLSDFKKDELTIFLSKGWEAKSGYLTETKITRSQIKNSEDGWFKVYSKSSGLEVNSSGFYGQLRIGFSENIRVREIVVVDVNGKLGTVTVSHCSNGPKPVGAGEYSAAHEGKFTPADVSNVCDEKSTFENKK